MEKVEERDVERGRTPKEIVEVWKDEIIKRAVESEKMDPQRLALFKIGKWTAERAGYYGIYAYKPIELKGFDVRDLEIKSVYFSYSGTIAVNFALPNGEGFVIDIRTAQLSTLGEEDYEKFEIEYNKYYRIYAQREISELNRRLTRARIALETILEEVRRKEPEIFQEVLIERATENASIEQLLEELGVEIEDC